MSNNLEATGRAAYLDGRLYVAQGKHLQALRMFNQALSAWSHIDNSEQSSQWVRSCQFHRLLALGRLYGPGRWRETAAFSKSEPSFKKRLAAWASALFGGTPNTGATSRNKWS